MPATSSIHHWCSVKKVFLQILQNSRENTCARVACNFIKKEALAQVFSCEFCEISKNTFFHRKSLMVASTPLTLKNIELCNPLTIVAKYSISNIYLYSSIDISEYTGYATLHDIIECKHWTKNKVFHYVSCGFGHIYCWNL